MVGLALLPLCEAEGPVVVAAVFPTLATDGPEEPLPQPAASTQMPTSATTRRPARQNRARARGGPAAHRVDGAALLSG